MNPTDRPYKRNAFHHMPLPELARTLFQVHSLPSRASHESVLDEKTTESMILQFLEACPRLTPFPYNSELYSKNFVDDNSSCASLFSNFPVSFNPVFIKQDHECIGHVRMPPNKSKAIDDRILNATSSSSYIKAVYRSCLGIRNKEIDRGSELIHWDEEKAKKLIEQDVLIDNSTAEEVKTLDGFDSRTLWIVRTEDGNQSYSHMDWLPVAAYLQTGAKVWIVRDGRKLGESAHGPIKLELLLKDKIMLRETVRWFTQEDGETALLKGWSSHAVFSFTRSPFTSERKNFKRDTKAHTLLYDVFFLPAGLVQHQIDFISSIAHETWYKSQRTLDPERLEILRRLAARWKSKTAPAAPALQLSQPNRISSSPGPTSLPPVADHKPIGAMKTSASIANRGRSSTGTAQPENGVQPASLPSSLPPPDVISTIPSAESSDLTPKGNGKKRKSEFATLDESDQDCILMDEASRNEDRRAATERQNIKTLLDHFFNRCKEKQFLAVVTLAPTAIGSKGSVRIRSNCVEEMKKQGKEWEECTERMMTVVGHAVKAKREQKLYDSAMAKENAELKAQLEATRQQLRQFQPQTFNITMSNTNVHNNNNDINNTNKGTGTTSFTTDQQSCRPHISTPHTSKI